MSETSDQDTYDGGTELVAYAPQNRTVDLRDRSTDSWTDVLPDAISLARGIANTEFVPAGLRGSEAKVTAAILYSRELGLAPMTGLGATHVIEGKAGISAEMMRALVLQAGHELHIVESTRERCTIRGRRRGSEEWTSATWTIQEAHQTQVFISKAQGWGPLSGKSQWKSWPTEMLLARATTRLVRMIFPDVAHGMRTMEELQDMSAEVVDAEATQAPPEAAPVQRRRKARPAARPAPEPAPAPAQEPADAEVDELPTEPANTVQRARKERPAPTPAPEPQPEADAPVEAEVVDAEVVDEPAPKPATKADDPTRKAVTAALMHWKRLGVDDRAERLWLTGEVIGRPITSSNDMTLDEARLLANRLERTKDRAALEAAIDQAKTAQ